MNIDKSNQDIEVEHNVKGIRKLAAGVASFSTVAVLMLSIGVGTAGAATSPAPHAAKHACRVGFKSERVHGRMTCVRVASKTKPSKDVVSSTTQQAAAPATAAAPVQSAQAAGDITTSNNISALASSTVATEDEKQDFCGDIVYLANRDDPPGFTSWTFTTDQPPSGVAYDECYGYFEGRWYAIVNEQQLPMFSTVSLQEQFGAVPYTY